ncbi:hypothetical protein SLEP1_g52645 [Rubroshorea leprosula]|uniref:Uncharacterized protein n=1 Tax=Rubroshorea leprosula TaxID=152421 RepID=A0AAV5M6X4_9ROSI|nr:hypothetical protein SLEP1_g52645 [Rubroshorea leprosula]
MAINGFNAVFSLTVMMLLMMAAAAANEYTNHTVGGDAGWFFDPVTDTSVSKLHFFCVAFNSSFITSYHLESTRPVLSVQASSRIEIERGEAL